MLKFHHLLQWLITGVNVDQRKSRSVPLPLGHQNVNHRDDFTGIISQFEDSRSFNLLTHQPQQLHYIFGDPLFGIPPLGFAFLDGRCLGYVKKWLAVFAQCFGLAS